MGAARAGAVSPRLSGRRRIEFGDWQTPDDLADEALARVLSCLPAAPRSVLEPTCGQGAFVCAARRRLPEAELVGYEIDPAHASVAAARCASARVQVADFFATDWEREIASLADPLLVLGNPPWVTSSDLGALGGTNLPAKRNFKGHRGVDAITGKGNFDVSEWMILRLLAALSGRDATLAMLCKSAVARRVVEGAAQEGWPVRPGAMWRIDAQSHFDASVDAVLLLCGITREPRAASASWPVYASMDAGEPAAALGVAGGSLVADLAAYARTRHLAGSSSPEWRSGLKHDAARVMELRRHGDAWMNGFSDVVDVEPDLVYPLLKCSDVAHGQRGTDRAVIVPQKALGEDTLGLCDRAPRLWAYLGRHQRTLDARKSSIYRGRPPFSIFGVGDYAFAPWKVAVSGLHKRLGFRVIGPREGRPVMLDDTCYFLPFAGETEARQAARALQSALAADFFQGRVFWDSKRPITKGVLQALDLSRLERALTGRKGEEDLAPSATCA